MNRLGPAAAVEAAEAAIADKGDTVQVSAASGWGITTKHRLGKLPMADAWSRRLATRSTGC